MILDQYFEQLEYNGAVKTLLENNVSFKTLLIHALDGIGTGTMRQSEQFVKQGLAKFCGNQHNEDWCWTNIADLSCYDLVQLYLKVSTQAKTTDEIIEDQINSGTSIEELCDDINKSIIDELMLKCSGIEQYTEKSKLQENAK
jgi:hypothetical protein